MAENIPVPYLCLVLNEPRECHLKRKKLWAITSEKFLTDQQIIDLTRHLVDRRDLAISRGSKNIQPIKEYYIIQSLLGTGARVFEFAALKNRDLHGHKIDIRNGKGGKPRTVLLTRQFANILKEWLVVKEKLGFCMELNSPLFPSRYNKHYGVRGIQKIVKDVFLLLSFPRHLSAHSLRHTNCSLLLKTGKVSLATVRDNLGHSSIAVTNIYSHATGSIEDVELVPSSENLEKDELQKKKLRSDLNNVSDFLRKTNFKKRDQK